MRDNVYQQILSLDNIQKAYFEVTERLTTKGLSGSYAGVDSLGLEYSDFNIEKVVNTVREELLQKSQLIPASCHEIGKRVGGTRDIYIYSIKDRIKAQAISRVLEPIFEKVYSPFLFSYRSTHPSHLAARSVVRRYHRYFGQDNVLVIDLKQYSDNIDSVVLLEQLVDLNLTEDVLDLIKLFLQQKIVKDKKIFLPTKGLVQGVPLVALFANLYLNKIDWQIGKKVSLYRRVGDDLIVFDKNFDRVESIYDFLRSELAKLKLEYSEHKTKIINSGQEFEYLGYLFHDGVVAISKSGELKICDEIKKRLKFYPTSEEKKVLFLKNKIFYNIDSIYYFLKNTIDHYRFVNDYEQVKRISEKIFHILTRYFFGIYSERNRRLTTKLCQDLKIPSFYKLFLQYHNARNKK